jgi:hypothetical protein
MLCCSAGVLGSAGTAAGWFSGGVGGVAVGGAGFSVTSFVESGVVMSELLIRPLLWVTIGTGSDAGADDVAAGTTGSASGSGSCTVVTTAGVAG